MHMGGRGAAVWTRSNPSRARSICTPRGPKGGPGASKDLGPPTYHLSLPRETTPEGNPPL